MSMAIDARKYYNDFHQALNDLRAKDARADLRAVFVEDLNKKEFDLARAFSDAQIIKRQIAAQACTQFLRNMTTLNNLPPCDPRLAAPQQAVYTQLLAFANALVEKPRHSLAAIRLLNTLTPRVEEVLKNNTDASRKALAREIKNLNLQLETNPAYSTVCKVGRGLYGALKVLLGVALLVLGLTTWTGALLIAGVGLYTRGRSLGPLTWGKDLCVSGVRTMTSGPSAHQRESARVLGNEVLSLKDTGEPIQPRPGK